MDNIAQVLVKVGAHLFDNWTYDEARVSKDNFYAVLMMPGVPQYESLRMCAEKWKVLQILGFAVALNKTTLQFNIPEIRAYIDRQRE